MRERTPFDAERARPAARPAPPRHDRDGQCGDRSRRGGAQRGRRLRDARALPAHARAHVGADPRRWCARSRPRTRASAPGAGSTRSAPSSMARRSGSSGWAGSAPRWSPVARAFGMDVIAWSQNLDAARATGAGAEPVAKDELFRRADVVSVHYKLSDRSRGIVGRGASPRCGRPRTWSTRRAARSWTRRALLDGPARRRDRGRRARRVRPRAPPARRSAARRAAHGALAAPRLRHARELPRLLHRRRRGHRRVARRPYRTTDHPGCVAAGRSARACARAAETRKPHTAGAADRRHGRRTMRCARALDGRPPGGGPCRPPRVNWTRSCRAPCARRHSVSARSRCQKLPPRSQST